MDKFVTKGAAAGGSKPPAQPLAAGVVNLVAKEEHEAAATAKAAARAAEAEEKLAAARAADAARKRAARAMADPTLPAGAQTSLTSDTTRGWKERFSWLDTTSAGAVQDAKRGGARCMVCPPDRFALSLASIKHHNESIGHVTASAAVAATPSAEGFAVVAPEVPSKLKDYRLVVKKWMSVALVAGGIVPQQLTDLLIPLAPAFKVAEQPCTDANVRQEHIPAVVAEITAEIKAEINQYPGVLLFDAGSNKFGDGQGGRMGATNFLWWSAYARKPLFLRTVIKRKAANEDGTDAKEAMARVCGGGVCVCVYCVCVCGGWGANRCAISSLPIHPFPPHHRAYSHLCRTTRTPSWRITASRCTSQGR